MRWNIEKVFDEFKKKHGEIKAWASSAPAKSIRAQFLCLTRNLLHLFDSLVLKPQAVKNHAEDKRREQRFAKTKSKVQEKGGVFPCLVELLQHGTQINPKFIRWIRYHFNSSTSCWLALDSLRKLYAKL